MAIVVNTSAAKISAAPRAVVKRDGKGGAEVTKPKGKMYDFIPGMITEVDDEDLKRLRGIPSIERAFEEDILVTGKEAKKVARKAKKETKLREEDEKEKESETE